MVYKSSVNTVKIQDVSEVLSHYYNHSQLLVYNLFGASEAEELSDRMTIALHKVNPSGVVAVTLREKTEPSLQSFHQAHRYIERTLAIERTTEWRMLKTEWEKRKQRYLTLHTGSVLSLRTAQNAEALQRLRRTKGG